MRGILYKGLSLCITLSMLFSVPISANNSDSVKPEEYLDNSYDSAEKGLKETTIYIVGDSTSCEYGYDEKYAIPRAGWGMYLSEFLNDKANVINLALSGRSSKSFTAEENYKKLFENIKKAIFFSFSLDTTTKKTKPTTTLTQDIPTQQEINTQMVVLNIPSIQITLFPQKKKEPFQF